MYPRICIDLKKLNDNTEQLINMTKRNHISSLFVVVKVLAGDLRTVSEIAKHDIAYIADSRIENLKQFAHIAKPKALMRLPMISEANRVVKYADLSLNSELKTIIKLNNAAKKLGKIHDIILMFDLGDLREGVFYQDDYIDLVDAILGLDNIRLRGIGTNLTCFGGVIPSHENLSTLVKIAHSIENQFDIKLELISGGNSSSIHLFDTGKIPSDINCLRIGESLMLARETAYGERINGLHEDVFTLEVELIEVKSKPSYPIGEIGMNSFGEVPSIIDQGDMVRGIAAIGKQDIQLDNLFPIDSKVKVVGGSSDHLILDLSDTKYGVGDILQFRVNYPGLLQIMTSHYVKKDYL